MDYRLIVTDLDDTLFGNDLVIHPQDRQALADAAAAGVTLVVATGRMFDSALPYVKMFCASGPVICCQGAAVVDAQTRQVLLHQPIPLALAREVLAFADELGLYAQYYSLDDFFYTHPCSQSRLYESIAGVTGRAVGEPLVRHMAEDPTKILFIAEDDAIRNAYEKAKTRWGEKMEIGISKSCYLEFTHPDANKGAAVRRVAEHMGVPMEQVMCIGDGINDLPMIQAAGLGVAMGNGAPELKAAADFVTLPRWQGGVAHAINKFVLHRE